MAYAHDLHIMHRDIKVSYITYFCCNAQLGHSTYKFIGYMRLLPPFRRFVPCIQPENILLDAKKENIKVRTRTHHKKNKQTLKRMIIRSLTSEV